MLGRMLAISPSHFNEIFISAFFSCTLLLGCLRICRSLVWTWTPLNLAASGSGHLNIWWARANSAVRIQLPRFNSNVKIVNGRKLGCHKQYVYSWVGAQLTFAARKSKEEREAMETKMGFKKKHITLKGMEATRKQTFSVPPVFCSSNWFLIGNALFFYSSWPSIIKIT